MEQDPRAAIVDVMAKLGRETQLHLDERHRHFKITDVVIIGVSLILVIVAMFNVYYVHVLYQDLNGIVNNMDSMHNNLRDVQADMSEITYKVEAFDEHMAQMIGIEKSMASLSKTMPLVREDMTGISGNVSDINSNMALLGQGMINIDQRFQAMTNGVAVMRHNVGNIAGPMGSMNSFLPGM